MCVVLVVAACYLGHVKIIDWLIDWLIEMAIIPGGQGVGFL